MDKKKLQKLDDIKNFQFKTGNRDHKGSSLNTDALFMKKEHKQTAKRYGHKDIYLVNIRICYPMHSTEIPILTSLCNTSLHVHNN